MYFLITSDFYTDYELVKANNLAAVKDYINQLTNNGDYVGSVEIITSSDSTDFESIKADFDFETIYLSEYGDWKHEKEIYYSNSNINNFI